MALWLVCHFGLVPPTFLGSVEVSRDRQALRFVTRVLLKLVSRTLRTSLQGARASDFGRTDSSVTGSDSVYVPWGESGGSRVQTRVGIHSTRNHRTVMIDSPRGKGASRVRSRPTFKLLRSYMLSARDAMTSLRNAGASKSHSSPPGLTARMATHAFAACCSSLPSTSFR